MMFWFIAITIAVVAALFIAWPLLKMPTAIRNYGMMLVVSIPLAALFLYQQIGTPSGITVSGTPVSGAPHVTGESGNESMDDLLSQLEQRLLNEPDNLEGWLMLGRSYKTMQQYGKAEQALSLAAGLAPDDPLVLVELAEARLYASGQARIGGDIRQMLERAVSIDPAQQKGLWLLGLAATQSGDDESAINYWQKLLDQVESDAAVAASVREQINLARQRLGQDTESSGEGYRLRISLADPTYVVPPGAILYVIASDPDAPRPPLGVRRIANPQFPLDAGLTDADSMMPERPVSSVNPVRLMARLSLKGDPVAGSGDLESNAASVSADSTQAIALELSARPD